MHEMQSILTDVRGVCQSVCLSRGSSRLHCAKMAEQIKMLCNSWSYADPRLGHVTYFYLLRFPTYLRNGYSYRVQRLVCAVHSMQPLSNYFGLLLCIGRFSMSITNYINYNFFVNGSVLGVTVRNNIGFDDGIKISTG